MDLVAAATPQHSSPVQEQRDVRPEASRQPESSRLVEAFAGEVLQREERGSGIAASASQTTACRNAFFQSHGDLATKGARPLPERTRSIDQVLRPAGGRGIIAYNPNVASVGGAASSASPRLQLNLETVVERHRLIDGVDFVVAVGPFAEDAQTQINLGEGADLDGVSRLQG